MLYNSKRESEQLHHPAPQREKITEEWEDRKRTKKIKTFKI